MLSLATGQATFPEKNTEIKNYELIADLLYKATTTKKFKAEVQQYMLFYVYMHMLSQR